MASFGESLKRERELRGVTLQEIAASTKIGVSMLQAIEDDRLDKLPQGLFVRGFIREYARFLALDEQKILTELNFHEAQAPQVDHKVGERGRRVSNRLAARLVNGTMALGGLGLVAALILSPGFSRTSAPAAGTAAIVTQAPEISAAASGSSVAGHDQTNAESTLVASNGLSVGASVGASVGMMPSVLPSDHVAAPASVLPQPLQLTLTATEDCWIGLDVGGDRVENRVLKKGESFSITARQNASLAVGNAGGLLVAIDSGPPRPLGNRGEVKRNIPLSPEAIGALSAGSQTAAVKPIG